MKAGGGEINRWRESVRLEGEREERHLPSFRRTPPMHAPLAKWAALSILRSRLRASEPGRCFVELSDFVESAEFSFE